VDQSEIANRLATHKPMQAPPRGYAALYHNSVTQAPLGCDFDFLAGN
jgi:dihydroxy-acid dehydratase